MVKEDERAEMSREGFVLRVLLLRVSGWLVWKVVLLFWFEWGFCCLGGFVFGCLRVGWYGERGAYRLRE